MSAPPQGEPVRFPVCGPQVWTAGELEGRSGWQFSLDAAMADELVRQARSAFGDGGDPTIERVLDPWTPPVWLDALLASVRASLAESGVALIRGFPVEALGAVRAARLYRAIGEQLGRALTQNSRCEFLSPVFNEGVRFGYGDTPSSQGRGYRSQAQLNHHSDPTDVVGLLCVRKAPAGGLSSIVSAAAIWNTMLAECPEHLAVLEAGFPYDRKGEEGAGEAPVTEPIPVFARRGARLDCRYARSYVIGAAGRLGWPLSAPQLAALDAFDAIASRPGIAVQMAFEPGDIQLLDNLAVLHGRTAFEDHPDPAQGRLLYRLWLQMEGGSPWDGVSEPMRWYYARFGMLGRCAAELPS